MADRGATLKRGLIVAALLTLAGCVLFRPWAPTGVPGCPNKSAWSDSAQKCLPIRCTQPTEWSDSLGMCVVWLKDTTDTGGA